MGGSAVTDFVLAAQDWNTNADLIADCARLGYLKSTDRILDPTFHRGLWWKKWKPAWPGTLVINRNDHDFRAMPYPDGRFDAIAFDPPYVAQGGRSTSTVQDFLHRYGLFDCPQTPPLLQQLINDGLTEMHRLVKPRGIVLVKCKDYVSSGRLWLGTHYTLTHALALGFTCLDRLEHTSRKTGPQPRVTQVHARRNLSTLFVLKKGR